jgi:hypothetical protein
MRIILALPVATLLFISATCMAATVSYQHHDLTIVAKQEPLDSVLKSLGKEMRIYVTIPTGLNLVVNCDIQQQPVKQAFKTLLGDMSYSLEWEEKTGRLVGLTILAGGNGAVWPAISNKPTYTQSAEQAALGPVASSGELQAGLPVEQGDTAMAANEIQTEAGREEEPRVAVEQEAQTERLKEEAERHDHETADYLESVGLSLDQ